MATSVIFWNLESGNLEIWKLPGIGWFWPISMYWVFFPLSFCHWTWFCAQKFKIPVFLKSGIWKSGNLEVAWNLLFCANSYILGIIPTQFWSQKLILSSEFQNSSFPEIWNLEIWKYGICLELADFDQFQCVGYFSHLVFVTLCSEIQNSSFPEILPEIFWKSGKSLECAVLGQFQHIGYHFHSVLVTEIDFEPRISRFQFSWDLESGHFLEFGWYWPISMYWVFFPLSFCHWTWFSAQKFKFPVFQKFIQKLSGNRENLLLHGHKFLIIPTNTRLKYPIPITKEIPLKHQKFMY